jgi:hypothetical protein
MRILLNEKRKLPGQASDEADLDALHIEALSNISIGPAC